MELDGRKRWSAQRCWTGLPRRYQAVRLSVSRSALRNSGVEGGNCSKLPHSPSFYSFHFLLSFTSPDACRSCSHGSAHLTLSFLCYRSFSPFLQPWMTKVSHRAVQLNIYWTPCFLTLLAGGSFCGSMSIARNASPRPNCRSFTVPGAGAGHDQLGKGPNRVLVEQLTPESAP